MKLENMFKTIPDASIEEAIKQALDNLKISNRILLLARRELKRRRKEERCVA